ncbi:MAG TPA: hypothetical protein VJT81_14495 [Burkholderiales bacterium]|nr:hypothetical protein [Burkholderiales bacterium]
MKVVHIVVAVLLSVFALAGIASQQPASSHDSNVTGTTKLPDLLSMGPDPGGHSGATVTPETSKTGQPAVDSARQSASGGKTENSGPPVNTSEQSKKK